jgi:aspartyl-tRNA(Asn)/glutamyl-tRNA(Gln) amidotransferase subunit A
MTSQEPWTCSASELGALYASGRLTPTGALEAVLDRVEAINPRINAIVTLDSSGARAAAQASSHRWREGRALGPLDGVPITIKDNLEVAGLRCTWGSPLFAQHVPREDELPIARLRAAGAIIVGKTNCSEFAVFGVTRNPWDTTRTAGGSSGGAVAAVAAGLAPLALGTDGGGSTRRPAAHTGLVGFKPTVGRIARAGGLPPLFLQYEVCGPIARTVADVVLLTRALASPSPRDPASQALRFKPFEPSDMPGRLRILHIPTFGHAPVDPEISALIERAASRFAALGHHVERAGHWDVADAVNDRWMTLSQCGLARMLDSRDPQELAHALSPIARINATAGRAASGAALLDLFESVSLMQQRLGDCLSQFDVLLTPATAAFPWPVAHTHPESIAGQPVGPRGHAVFTGFVNAAGLPAIALPCGLSVDGLPNGLQLVGRWGDDDLLLALAAQWEREERGFERWPPI